MYIRNVRMYSLFTMKLQVCTCTITLIHVCMYVGWYSHMYVHVYCTYECCTPVHCPTCVYITAGAKWSKL